MALIRSRTRGDGPSTASVTTLGRGERRRDQELDRCVQQASLLSQSQPVDHQLGWKTPVIGHLWRIFRRRIHQEIRIYIDALTRQQTGFNTNVVRGLQRVSQRLESGVEREEVESLRAEVAALRAEVEALRDSLKGAERA